MVGSIAWSHDGKQLHYLSPDSALMAADVQLRGNEFHTSAPRQIFSAPGGIEWVNAAPDGRILVSIHTEPQNTPPMTVVLNWDQQVNK